MGTRIVDLIVTLVGTLALLLAFAILRARTRGKVLPLWPG